MRQYYTDGFYPAGERSAGVGFTPSAALLKATLISAARPVPRRKDIVSGKTVAALPVPSHEQGWGFPVLDDALYFAGDSRRLRVRDVVLENGLAQGGSSTLRLDVRAGTPLKAVLVWTDPPGTVRGPSDTAPQLVNDLDLRVSAAGTVRWGNGASPDRLNNVEVVSIESPAPGTVEITVSAHRLGFGSRQGYALVVTGDFAPLPAKRRAVRR